MLYASLVVLIETEGPMPSRDKRSNEQVSKGDIQEQFYNLTEYDLSRSVLRTDHEVGNWHKYQNLGEQVGELHKCHSRDVWQVGIHQGCAFPDSKQTTDLGSVGMNDVSDEPLHGMHSM